MIRSTDRILTTHAGALPRSAELTGLIRQVAAKQPVDTAKLHAMLQKEIVERMVAAPGDSNFSRLSVMIQYHFAVELLIEVPPTAFRPAPKVDSAVVRLLPLRP